MLLGLSSFMGENMDWVSWVFMSLYLALGMYLLGITILSKIKWNFKSWLYITGSSTVLIIISILVGMFEFQGHIAFFEPIKDRLSISADLFVITTLSLAIIFWIGAIGSLRMLGKN